MPALASLHAGGEKCAETGNRVTSAYPKAVFVLDMEFIFRLFSPN